MPKTMLPQCEMLLHNREQLVARLQMMYDKGYRYIVRDNDSQFVYCYSAEPKKYREFNGWGYRDPDARNILPAFPVKCIECTEISYSNKQPIILADWLENNKGAMGHEVS